MVRNLKILILAVVALTVISASSASGAQAAEFHCSEEPCRLTLKPDGAVPSLTAHQAFRFNSPKGDSIEFTCNSVSGEATQSAKTSPEITLTSIEYQTCGSGGFFTAVKMNGCDYLFTAAGQMSINCPVGQQIEWFTFKCVVTIGPQGPLSGVNFHNVGFSKSEITVENLVKGIKGTIDESPTCLVAPGASEAEFRTTNSILTAEKDNAGVEMVKVWWE
jgi:hypothetical protein